MLNFIYKSFFSDYGTRNKSVLIKGNDPENSNDSQYLEESDDKIISGQTTAGILDDSDLSSKGQLTGTYSIHC